MLRYLFPAGLTLSIALEGAITLHAQQTGPSDAQAIRQAAIRAALFFHQQVGREGGYLWYYSGDLKLREAEGLLKPREYAVQPPGTPAIGVAFLDAWLATGEPQLLEAAETTANCLLKGQLHSGGWDHSFHIDDKLRESQGYRDLPLPKKPESRTSLDDDITTSALRFLMRFDAATKFQHREISESTHHALNAIRGAQFPNGAWYQWWLQFPKEPASAADYPVKPASYPETWPWEWDNKWTGRYVTNDNVIVNAIDTLLLARQIYHEDQWLDVARKAGDFLLLAQMPDPQPAWAQQYDPAMHPVWDRKFEPPSISSRESERILLGLIRLYHATGDARYLEPHKRAIPYLKTCLMPDGQVPRFLELKTNKPLYFEREGKVYRLTYDASKLPKHYGFITDSILNVVESEWRAAQRGPDPAKIWFKEPPAPPLPSVAEVLRAMDERGAWVEQGGLDFHEVKPPSGILSSNTFIRNLGVLCQGLPTISRQGRN